MGATVDAQMLSQTLDDHLARSERRFDVVVMANTVNHLDEHHCSRLHCDASARATYRAGAEPPRGRTDPIRNLRLPPSTGHSGLLHHQLDVSSLAKAVTGEVMMRRPPELVPLAILRSLTGSGSLAFTTDLVKTHGPDSLIARTAANDASIVRETTFSVPAVYVGAIAVRRTRHAVPAAPIAAVAVWTWML